MNVQESKFWCKGFIPAIHIDKIIESISLIALMNASLLLKNPIMKNELKKIYDQLNQIKNDQGESLKIIEGLLTNFHTDKKKKALDGWLFIEEVKEILGISTSTIYRYMENGTLSCSRFGSRLIFKISDINAIIDRNYKRFHLPNSKNESDFDDEDFEGDLEILD